MVNANAAFIGAIPENYDAYLGPLFFHQFADDIVERVSVFPGVSILETACGTGIVTERLLARLGGNGRLVATDLNEAMFLHARRRACRNIASLRSVATSRPFPPSRANRRSVTMPVPHAVSRMLTPGKTETRSTMSSAN